MSDTAMPTAAPRPISSEPIGAWGTNGRAGADHAIVHIPSYQQGRDDAIAMLRRLADVRDEYLQYGASAATVVENNEAVTDQTTAVRAVADILDKKDSGWSWMPSWRWAEFGVDENEWLQQ